MAKLRIIVITLLLFLVILSFYSMLFISAPILTEAREFVYQGRELGHFSWVEFLLAPHGYNRRLTSMAFFAIQRDLCSFNSVYINLFQLILLSVCATLLFVHALQITKSEKIAGCSVFLWIFSAAAAETALWQATQHDKLALLFSFLALIMSYHFVNAERIKGAKSVLLSNTVGIGLCTLALNSKEISFFLPFALFAEAMLFASGETKEDRLHGIMKVIGPIAYSSFYIASYLVRMHGSSSWWASHVTGGDFMQTIAVLAGFLLNVGNLFNMGNWSPLSHITEMVAKLLFLVWLVGVGVFVTLELLPSHGKLRPQGGKFKEIFKSPEIKTIVYCSVIFVATMATLCKTKHPAAYYLLIPGWAFYVIVVSISFSMVEKMFRRKGISAFAILSMLSMFPIGFLGHFFEGAAIYRLTRQGNALTESYKEIRTKVEKANFKSALFVFDEMPDGYWYFFNCNNEKIDQYILPFVFQRDVVVPITYTVGRSISGNRSDEFVVSFTKDLKLRYVRVGSKNFL